MFYSDITAYFIILATAVTLNVAGVTDIETAAEAAGALRPLAGDFAYLLFASGILGVGLIGVPVLAGSAAYALSEAMDWRSGLELKARRSRLLRRHRRQRPGRPCHAIFADQSHEGAVLERGDQRGRRCSADGGDHTSCVAPIGHGQVHRKPADSGPWLDWRRDHGRRGCSNDRSLRSWRGGNRNQTADGGARLVGGRDSRRIAPRYCDNSS
jgi:hypothetical protein